MKKLNRIKIPILRVFGVVVILLLSTTSLTFAQNTWIKEYDPFNVVNSLSEQYSPRRLIKSNSAYVVGGYFEYIDSVDVSGWGFLMKINQNGKILWTTQDYLGTGIITFIETADSGFLCSGWERFTENRYLIKRDTRGIFQWIKPNIDFCPYTLLSAENGNILAGGKSLDFNKMVIKKLTESGDVIWEKKIEFEDESEVNLLSSIKTKDGHYVFCGWVDVDGSGNKDTFVVTLDKDGTILWTRSNIDFSGSNKGVELTESSSGYVMVIGRAEDQFGKDLGLFWLLDTQGNTINFLVGEDNFSQACGSVLALPDDEFICGSPKLMKIDKKFDIIWSRDHLCGGGENKICLTENGGYIFPSRYKDSFLITKTDSLGLIEDNKVDEYN